MAQLATQRSFHNHEFVSSVQSPHRFRFLLLQGRFIHMPLNTVAVRTLWKTSRTSRGVLREDNGVHTCGTMKKRAAD